jgi:LPXTG-motif cell wall-anchored protein
MDNVTVTRIVLGVIAVILLAVLIMRRRRKVR